MLRRRQVWSQSWVKRHGRSNRVTRVDLTVQQWQMIRQSWRGAGVHYLLITRDRAEAYWAGAGKHLQTQVCLLRFQRQACKMLHTNQRITAHDNARHLWRQANEKLHTNEKGNAVMDVSCNWESTIQQEIEWTYVFFGGFILLCSPQNPIVHQTDSATAIVTIKHLLYGHDLWESVRHIWHRNSHRTQWTLTAWLDARLHC